MLLNRHRLEESKVKFALPSHLGPKDLRARSSMSATSNHITIVAAFQRGDVQDGWQQAVTPWCRFKSLEESPIVSTQYQIATFPLGMDVQSPIFGPKEHVSGLRLPVSLVNW